jgi:hypothetical protein
MATQDPFAAALEKLWASDPAALTQAMRADPGAFTQQAPRLAQDSLGLQSADPWTVPEGVDLSGLNSPNLPGYTPPPPHLLLACLLPWRPDGEVEL